MKWAFAALLAAPAASGVADARSAAPIYDPVSLNIGLNCKWDERCIKQQQRAMRRATGFVQSKRPATWRIQQCNRNAARGRSRVDWIGFDNCIRNASLRYTPPSRPTIKYRPHLSRR